MALTVNGESFPFREGLTVTEVLEAKKYSWPLKTVYVEGTRIPKDQWETTVLRDDETVKVIHLMAGG
jgi:sulfur carrier protein